MSAFLCSEKHLSTLAFELVWRNIAGRDVRTTEKSVLEALLKTNLDSLKARYPDDEDEEIAYRFKPERGLPLMQIYKLAECYEYQSCEHDGWENSQEKKWMEALRRAIIDHLPEYKAASWSID